jgi:hypothetical protein
MRITHGSVLKSTVFLVAVLVLVALAAFGADDSSILWGT